MPRLECGKDCRHGDKNEKVNKYLEEANNSAA